MEGGDLTRQGPEAMYQALYVDLKKRAQRERRKLPTGHTLATTALVNEAYLKLMDNGGYADRGHFMNTAAAAMRQVLVDAARAAMAGKRGSGERALSLDDSQLGLVPVDPAENPESMLALHTALEELADLNTRLAKVVECRFFGGFSEDETAQALDVTSRTVRRDWIKARAWLYDALS